MLFARFVIYKLFTLAVFSGLCVGAIRVTQFYVDDNYLASFIGIIVATHMVFCLADDDSDTRFKKSIIMRFKHFREIFPK